ncbi:protein of unknown function [Aminobacter niigataensis]|nr:protein of unknown function [Aminobacter niigataensis]
MLHKGSARIENPRVRGSNPRLGTTSSPKQIACEKLAHCVTALGEVARRDCPPRLLRPAVRSVATKMSDEFCQQQLKQDYTDIHATSCKSGPIRNPGRNTYWSARQ